MKNDKKGFTLIELLAVIVILAIIILIAVNVIIPLINKSKKKSFIDEANVYINGAMNHRAIDTDSGTADSTCVTIEELNQEYIKKHSSNYSGVVKIDNVDGELAPTIYLTNGKYYVVGGNNIKISNVTTEEPNGFKTSCDESVNFEVGSIFKIADDEFYYIGSDGDNIKLLTRYYVDNTIKQSTNIYNHKFSSSNYWSNSSDYEPWGDSTYKYAYRKAANKNSTAGDGDNAFKGIINAYKNYLDGLNIISISDARLMAYEEAEEVGCTEANNSCNENIADMAYCLGSSGDNGGLWCVNSSTNNLYCRSSNWFNVNSSYSGVRPVIVISSEATYTGTGTEQDPYVITG